MQFNSFEHIEAKFGAVVAQFILTEIERAAHIRAGANTDYEERLQAAYHAQDRARVAV